MDEQQVHFVFLGIASVSITHILLTACMMHPGMLFRVAKLNSGACRPSGPREA